MKKLASLLLAILLAMTLFSCAEPESPIGLPSGLNKAIDKLFTEAFLDDFSIWKDMHTYRGFSMATLPENELNAFIKAFKDRHSADAGLISDKTNVTFADGILTLELHYDKGDDTHWIYTLTNNTAGDWKLKWISRNSSLNEDVRNVTYTFEPDEKGNIRAWSKEGDDYEWAYVDSSRVDIGDVISEHKITYSGGISNITTNYKIADVRTAAKDTLIVRTNHYTGEVQDKTTDILLQKNEDSSLIWIDYGEGDNYVLWNGNTDSPFDILSANFPEIIKKELFSQLSPSDEYWDFEDFRVLINVESYLIVFNMPPTYDNSEILEAFNTDQWNKDPDNSNILHGIDKIDGITVMVDGSIVIFDYSGANKVTKDAFDSLIAKMSH